MIEAVLGRLRNMLTSAGAEPAQDPDLPLACLLVEAARADGRFEDVEREAVVSLLARRGRARGDAEALLARAEQMVTEAVQLLPWTRAIKEQMPVDERVAVIEHLFAVAWADGRLDPLEDQLIRRVAGLLYVSDRARGEAARRVRRRLGIDA